MSALCLIMDGATLLCTLADGSVVNRGESPWFPSGVFVPRKCSKFFTNVDALGANAWYNRDFEVGFLRESGDSSGPLTVTVAGHGGAIITNTGHQPLKIGQKYSVEFPTPADVEAQKACVKMGHTKMAHASLRHTQDLWGGFMATVDADRRSDVILKRFKTEMANEASGFIYALGKLESITRDKLAANAQTMPLHYYDLVRAGNVPRGATAAGLAALIDSAGTEDLAMAALEVMGRYRPRVWGVVQQAAIGGSSTDAIPTGDQFYGTITFDY